MCTLLPSPYPGTHPSPAILRAGGMGWGEFSYIFNTKCQLQLYLCRHNYLRNRVLTWFQFYRNRNNPPNQSAKISKWYNQYRQQVQSIHRSINLDNQKENLETGSIPMFHSNLHHRIQEWLCLSVIYEHFNTCNSSFLILWNKPLHNLVNLSTGNSLTSLLQAIGIQS